VSPGCAALERKKKSIFPRLASFVGTAKKRGKTPPGQSEERKSGPKRKTAGRGDASSDFTHKKKN